MSSSGGSGGSGLRLRGIWSGALAYAVNDWARYSGSPYICKTAVTTPALGSVIGLTATSGMSPSVQIADTVLTTDPVATGDTARPARCYEFTVLTPGTVALTFNSTNGNGEFEAVDSTGTLIMGLSTSGMVTTGALAAGNYYFVAYRMAGGNMPFTATAANGTATISAPANTTPDVDTAHWN